MERRVRVLTLASLFPGVARPTHGVFVKERLKDFVAATGAEVRVVAPVPFFPRWLKSDRYREFAATPRRETYDGFQVEHPRYVMIPRAGVPLQGMLYEIGCRATVRRLYRDFEFELIDAHYAYPDGFAAALLRHRLGVPMVLTVRGTDVNYMPQRRRLGELVRFALRSADAVVAVSRALADCAIAAGAEPAKVVVLRNGVDAARFAPLDMAECRRNLGLPDAPGRKVIASVGFLVERKGHALLLQALAGFPAAERPFLVIAGDGPERGALEALARDLHVETDVKLLGNVQHDALRCVYSAADLSALVSSREGWPNVLLESMACGTPVVATDVQGAAEAIGGAPVGRIVPERTPAAIGAAIRAALAAGFDRAAVRLHAEGMSWRETSLGIADLFARVLAERRR